METGSGNEDSTDCSKIKTSLGSALKKQAKVIKGKHDFYYDMNHRKRGMALIFNHKTFNEHGLIERNGTDLDCENLESCFTELDFEVLVYLDYKYENVTSTLEKLFIFVLVAKRDHSDYDCLVICVLSHGDMGVLYARDRAYDRKILWESFTPDKCTTLAGKPKIFIFQACQGDSADSGYSLIETDSPPVCKIPLHSDFLIVDSTFPGYYSWRDPIQGSWFVQALCKELKEKAFRFDLITILTFVNRRVAVDYESKSSEKSLSGKKQEPCIMSTLTRLILFRQKSRRRT